MLSHQLGDLRIKASYWIGEALDVGNAFYITFYSHICFACEIIYKTHSNHTIKRKLLMWNKIPIIEYVTIVVRIAIIMDVI